MGYFNQEFIDFFENLAKNNKKEWFHANKETYENEVKIPFKAFVDELIFRIQEFEPNFEVTSKQAIFRINRDLRFAKDKTPYKTYLSANMQPGGRTKAGHPGFYLHLGHNEARVGGGAYHADKHLTYAIRSKIVSSAKEFKKIIQDEVFVDKFGEVKGEKNKILPKEFKKPAITQPLLFNKQIYFMTDFEPEEMLKNDFSDFISYHYKAGSKLYRFLDDAMND